MKKLALVAVLAVGLLAGCSSGDKEKDSADSKTAESSTVVSSSKVEETTESSVSLTFKYPDQQLTDDLEIGNKPELTDRKMGNTDVQGLWLTIRGAYSYEPSTFFYVDGKLVHFQQLDDSFDFIPLTGSDFALTKGTHALELVQYADANDENSEITAYTQSQYKVK